MAECIQHLEETQYWADYSGSCKAWQNVFTTWRRPSHKVTWQVKEEASHSCKVSNSALDSRHVPRVTLEMIVTMPPRQTLIESLTPGSPPTQLRWGNRPVVEKPDFSVIPTWDDEEETESKGVKSFKVSEKTESFPSCAFTSTEPNQTRRHWCNKFGFPNAAATACPSINKILKTRIDSTSTKPRDRLLVKHQAFIQNAVGPIIVLEKATKSKLNQKGVTESAQTALKRLDRLQLKPAGRGEILSPKRTLAWLTWWRRTPTLRMLSLPYLEKTLQEGPKKGTNQLSATDHICIM